MSSSTDPTTAVYGFTVLAHIYVSPEKSDAFLDAFQKCFDNITQNPLCQLFQVYRSLDVPGKFTLTEDWNGTPYDLFEVEHKKPYFLEYIAVTEPMWTEPREVYTIERARPTLTFSKIPVSV
ncbi:hypothetical protein B0H66DRAFT_559893 [Apodospora peruviana]|uniref:ABM domain-containing protein n=1 Tax=Apodospora peruviana TaxID=516989 RepID=A0AAE0M1Z4_9PEZI|nr:hypothetical protein B0H66DRAFT_559893 [Apodospora peruviana]